MGIVDDIGPGPVALDSALFIYYIEDHPVFASIVAPLFEAIAAGRLSGVASALTLLEVLVLPLRTGNVSLAERYESLLRQSRGLDLHDLDLPVLRGAAQLRALEPGLRTPDALQISTALHARCSAIVTNDRRLPQLPTLRVLQLQHYLSTPE